MSIDENTPATTTTSEATPAAAEAPTTSAPAATAAPTDGGGGASVTGTPADASTTATTEQRPRRRGFAAMDRTRVKEIASKGGRAAHAAGTAHQFSADEARVAGKKGGLAPHVRRGGVRRRPLSNDAIPSSQQAPGQH